MTAANAEDDLREWDAKFWEGRDTLCLACMPKHVVNELRRQANEHEQAIKDGVPLGPIGTTGPYRCAKCGKPRLGPWQTLDK